MNCHEELGSASMPCQRHAWRDGVDSLDLTKADLNDVVLGLQP